MLHFENSPLMIGVTGNMDLRDVEVDALKKRVRTLFRFLKPKVDGLGRQKREAERKEMREALIDLLPQPPLDTPNPYQLGLRNWPSLDQTPILVLTSMAPGADQLVAKVALEDEFCNQEFHVIAPLPFPHDIYDQATTFTRSTTKRPVPGDDDRIADYKRLLKRIGEHRTFCVRTRQDEGLSKDAFYQRCVSDLSGRKSQQRSDRYYAAGEYIASHSHLLIAIWDDRYDATQVNAHRGTGTAAVVHARLHGHRIGALPDSIGLNQPHGGPVFHLVTHRRKNRAAPLAEGGAVAQFLHPVGANVDGERGNAVAAARQLSVDLSLFSRIVGNLEQFNTTACPGSPEADRELHRQLSWKSPGVKEPHRFSQVLLTKYHASKLFEHFRKLAVLHKRGSDHNGELLAKSQRTLFAMFAMALVAAMLTHLFSEWHPRSDTLRGLESARPWLGLTGVALAFAGIVWFWWRQPQRAVERGHDYRALAEGMRVQLFWNLAGLGRSVPANYMQRQRSELDWLRGAIHAASFPYEHWRERFEALDKLDQVAAIQCVVQNWVQEQVDYFSGAVKKKHRQLHFAHKCGGLFALTGLFGFVLLVASSAFAYEDVLGWLEAKPQFGLLLAALCAVGGLLVAGLRLPHLVSANATSLEPYPSRLGTWQSYVVRGVHWLLHHVVPTADQHAWQPRTPWAERMGLLKNFLCFLFPATMLALLTATVAAVLANLSDYLPDASIWTSVLLGIWILLGAMLGAWAEKNSISELAYQYSTMAPMFQTAVTRLEPLVGTLDDAARAANDKDFQRTLAEIHAILYDIGVEALDENAEWLILHRARPLEPVMAS